MLSILGYFKLIEKKNIGMDNKKNYHEIGILYVNMIRSKLKYFVGCCCLRCVLVSVLLNKEKLRICVR